MARRILETGFSLTVWNRSAARAAPLEALGAFVASTPREAAASADVVCTMLSDPAALEAVADGPEGLVAGLAPGKIWLDFSTVTPAASRRAAARAKEKGADFCDVPVAGSVKPANDGTLKLLAGGDEAVLTRAKEVLAAVSTETLHFGAVGQGSAMKLVNNLTFGVGLATFGEAVRLATKLGLPEERVMAWLLAAPTTSAYVQRKVAFLEGGGRPPQFGLALMEKDLRLALEAAGEDLPVVAGAYADLRGAAAAGFGAEDFSWVIPHLAGKRPGSK